MGNAGCCGDENKTPAEMVETEQMKTNTLPPEVFAQPEPDGKVAPLTVTIVSADGLDAAEQREVYCTCRLQGKTSGDKVQTRSQPLQANPEWYQEFQIDGYDKRDALEFNLFTSADESKTDEPVGKAVLLPEYIRPGFSGRLCLLDSKEGATLTVKVAFGGDYLDMPPLGSPPLGIQAAWCCLGDSGEYTVHVKKTLEDDKIGVDIVPQNGSVLRVKRIKDGLITNWNAEASEENKIKPGYFIVAVNGVRGNCDEILERISRDNDLVIIVRRVESN
mmetsp:Transcript_73981/g.165580  ORF Transcript_73981/g.165580 Transcript_73981/m.165580 type:complete len:276 (-) Transcript_73981:150-977(-)